VTGGLERALETSGEPGFVGPREVLAHVLGAPVASMALAEGHPRSTWAGSGEVGGEAPRTGRGDAEGEVGRWLPRDESGNPRLLPQRGIEVQPVFWPLS
jgi:hypothetical protein